MRQNYFTLYFHYVYFNVVRYLYLQTDNIFSMHDPGSDDCRRQDHVRRLFSRSYTAFGQVTNSFQYLVNSWPTIVELISIYKRLRAFEATLEGEPLPEIDQHYLERQARRGSGLKLRSDGIERGRLSRPPPPVSRRRAAARHNREN